LEIEYDFMADAGLQVDSYFVTHIVCVASHEQQVATGFLGFELLREGASLYRQWLAIEFDTESVAGVGYPTRDFCRDRDGASFPFLGDTEGLGSLDTTLRFDGHRHVGR